MTNAESEMMTVNFYDVAALSATTSTYESPEDEVRRLVGYMGIRAVPIQLGVPGCDAGRSSR